MFYTFYDSDSATDSIHVIMFINALLVYLPGRNVDRLRGELGYLWVAELNVPHAKVGFVRINRRQRALWVVKRGDASHRPMQGCFQGRVKGGPLLKFENGAKGLRIKPSLPVFLL